MKVLKFDEYVNERLFKSSIDRVKSGELRKEDGVKVSTCLGDRLVLSHKDCPCDKLIRQLLNNVETSMYPSIGLDEIDDYPVTIKDEIIEGKRDYTYLLGESNIVAGFDDYDELIKDYEIDAAEFSKDDYITIIRSIVEHLKKMNIINIEPESVDGSYISLLLHERNVTMIEDEMDSDSFDWFKKFRNNFNQTFPDVKFATWRGDFSYNIGIEIDYNAVIKYDDCLKWVKQYFNQLIGMKLFKI